MKKFIIKSTRWVKNGRKCGYFRDHNEFVETDNIEDYIKNHFIFGFGLINQTKRTFCHAVEVEDYNSGMFRFIEKVGGDRIYMNDKEFTKVLIKKEEFMGKYDYNLKGWLSA